MFVSAYQTHGRSMHIPNSCKEISLNYSIIMAGDLNCEQYNDWGCHVTNLNGVKTQTFDSNTLYAISTPDDPTYFPADSNR